METRIDTSSPAAVSGIGNGQTHAITFDVVLPGNVTNKITGNFTNFWCRSTMVHQIIPPLPQTNQTKLIGETIQALRQNNHYIPEDMIPANFQTEIGGKLQGLIGAKHLQEFPVPVMHLSNGLSIYRHSLRPAGSRSQVYCIGGTLPAVTAFKEAYGPNIHDITNYMLQCDLGAVTDVAFDGDVTTPSIRGLYSSKEFRQNQGEEDCQRLEQATAKATNAAPRQWRVFV